MAEKLTIDMEAKDRASKAIGTTKEQIDAVTRATREAAGATSDLADTSTGAVDANKKLGGSSADLERAYLSTMGALGRLTGTLERQLAASERANTAAEKGAEEVEDLGDEAEDAAEDVGKLDKANKSLGGTLGQVGLAMQGMREIYGATAGTVKALVSEQMEQLEVDSQLRFSLEQTGATAEEVAARMSEASGMFADAQSRTRFGDEDQARALTNLINITGDAEAAYAELGTVLDATQRTGKQVEQVSVALGRAMTGDIEQLRELNLLRKDEVSLLMQVEDSTERAALAMELVRDRTQGAAEAIDPMLQRSAQLTNDFGDVRQAAGNMVISATEAALQLAGLGDQSGETGSALSRLAGDINEAAEALGVFSQKREGLMGMAEDTTWNDNLHASLKQWADDLEGLDYINPITGLKALWDIPQGALAEHILGQNGTMQMEQFNEELEKIVEQRKEIMRDPPPEILIYGPEAPTAMDRMQQLIERQEQEAAAREEERAQARASQLAQQAAKERAAAEDRMALMDLELQAIRATSDEERERLELDRTIEEIKQRGLDDDEQQLAIDIARARAAAERAEREKAAADATEKKAKAQKQASDLAAIELQVLTARDELQKAELERQLAMERLNQRDLTDEQRKTELARIQIAYEETLEGIEDRRRAKRREDEERALAAINEQAAAAGELGDVLGRAMGSFGVDGLGDTVGALAGMREEFLALQAAGEGSAAAMAGALSAGSDAAGSAMEALGLGVRETAGIQAAFEAAAAVAAGASGNIPGAIAHGVAAGMFGAVAAGAGGGGGSGGAVSAASAGGGFGGRGPTRTPDPREMMEYQTQAYLEAMREYDREGQQIVINVNNQGANFFERQTASTQRVVGELERAAQLTVGGSALRG